MAELPGLEAPGAAPVAYLSEPLHDLAAWVRYFQEAEIPVLATTSQALEALRATEDTVTAGQLGALIDADPFMSIKVMAYVADQRRVGDSTETETVTSALVMMGVAPFFAHFGLQATVEDQLRDQPKALEGLRALLQRAQRAGRFALGFAVHRSDTDVAVIQHAALLHDFAEMLMWCHAPTLMLEIREMQRVNPTLRTASLQRFVFNIDLVDLRQALMRHWRLPELLVRISDGKHSAHPTVRNVLLAVRLARHTMQGWDNAALPDDINDIAQLLNATPRVALAYVRKIDEPPEALAAESLPATDAAAAGEAPVAADGAD